MIYSDQWVKVIKENSRFCGSIGKIDVIKQVDGSMIFITDPYFGEFLEADLEVIKPPTKNKRRVLDRDKLPRFQQILKVVDF